MSSPALLATYSGLVLVFLWENGGFEKRYTFDYCLFEIFPTLALSGLLYKGHGDFTKEDRQSHVLSLILAAIGQFLIGIRPWLLALGGISFGISHILVINQFITKMKKFSYGFAILILAYNVLLGDFFILPYFWSKPLTSIMCILYSFTLSSAVVISGSIYFYGRHGTGPNQKIDLIRFLGYFIFFLSDSVYLISHPDFSIPGSNFVVLTTYFTAIYLIMWGQNQSD
uniref:lysoplasmalogenase n=1 Tax=Acrobeloides nanus TaxID=290746 RepID=A0A914CVK3_9BILA